MPFRNLTGFTPHFATKAMPSASIASVESIKKLRASAYYMIVLSTVNDKFGKFYLKYQQIFDKIRLWMNKV